MVDPRIYRAGLVLVALAVIAFAFSLQSPPSPLTTTLAPPVSNGPSPYATMQALAREFPRRAPGSAGDHALAAQVAAQLRADRLAVSTSSFTADTAAGSRSLTQVVGSRAGMTPGTIVIVAHRDSATGSTADLSGTAVLLGVAHALTGETLGHSLMLVSTSGSVGAAGTTQLARSLTGTPVDAVIVLGDLAAAHPTRPLVLPWSDSPVLAPPVLRETLAHYAGALTGLPTGGASLPAQIAHLAFPLATGEQAPFGRFGMPAALLSLSGNRSPAASEPVDPAHVDALEGAVVQATGAIDQAGPVPRAGAYLQLGSQIVPPWAVRVLVLALILPVLLAAVDGLARARRRGHSVVRWLVWALASALPFLVVLGALLLVRVTDLLPATPPGPVAAGEVRLGAAGIATLALCGVLLVAGFVLLRPAGVRLAAVVGRRGTRGAAGPAGDGGGPASGAAGSAGDAAGLAVVTLTCGLATIAWLFNPFCAALLVPALHLWLWLARGGVREHRPVGVVLALLGIVPLAGVCAYYGHSLGLSPLGLAWSTVLLVAGGQLTSVVGILWSLVLGCFVAALIVAIRGGRARAPVATPVSVRGPVSYAGPGSLGGTESALGSRR